MISVARACSFFLQQGAGSHLRNVHHPPAFLIPPVPVQNQVPQCLQGQTLCGNNVGVRTPWTSHKWNKLTTTGTSVNERADPAGCPHPDVCDAFLQQLHLLLHLCGQTNRISCQNYYSFNWVFMIQLYLDVFGKKFHNLCFTFEGSQLSANETRRL